MKNVKAIKIPQINVNDEYVLLVEWLVMHGDKVKKDDPICTMESSKSVEDIETEQGGVIYLVAEVGTDCKVGQAIGYIGPNLKAIEAFLERTHTEQEKDSNLISKLSNKATHRAQALAQRYGISLKDVAKDGVKGTIKEKDVKHFIDQLNKDKDKDKDKGVESIGYANATLPDTLLENLIADRDLSKHEKSMIRNLRYTLKETILATVEIEVCLKAINDLIQKFNQLGKGLTIQHVIMLALGRILPSFPLLTSIHYQGKIYRYKNIDISFVVRNEEGRLFTPVLRNVDQIDLNKIINAFMVASVSIFKGKIKGKELEGGCFTVSSVALPGIQRFTAIPSHFQSAILSVPAENYQLALSENNQVVQVPFIHLTLTYDHTLCDASYASEFLGKLRQELEGILI